MKKCKYYVGCYGGLTHSGYSGLRIITKISDGVPLFEKEVAPLEFASEEADICMRKLLDEGWLAVTIRAPHNRKYLCWN